MNENLFQLIYIVYLWYSCNKSAFKCMRKYDANFNRFQTLVTRQLLTKGICCLKLCLSLFSEIKRDKYKLKVQIV